MMGSKSRHWLNVLTVVMVCWFSAVITGCGSSGEGEIAQTEAIGADKADADVGNFTKGIEDDDTAPFVDGELLVQTRAGVGREKFKEVLDGLGASIAEEIPEINIKRIKIPVKAQKLIRVFLAKHPHIKFVEKNYLAEATSIPNDDSYYSQWHLPKISAPTAWDISTGSPAVSIAIADSGVDPTHPDLAAKLAPGYNFVSGNTDTHDVYGHGTKVAGAAAAISNNNAGIAGVAWSNPIVPLVVANSSGYATYSAIAQAITYAADRGIRVINLSFAGSSSSTTLQNAVDYAWNKGTIVFASAGNYGTSTLQYPAACNHAVAVTATTSTDARSSFSSYGSWVTVAAPGSSILTTTNGGGYASVSGTSFSSPITAGLAALILSVNPNLTAAQVVDIIKQNGDDLGTAGFDQYFGYGRINAYKSLSAARNTVPRPSDTTAPVTSVTSPSNGATVSGVVTVNVTATDDTGVARVELYVNGALLAADTAAPYSFSWDTASSGAGTRYLKAIAYDAAGNAGQSSQVTVTVAGTGDTTAPVVIISNPVNGSSITGLTSVVLNASATSSIGVKRMEIYVDDIYKGYYSKSSISWTWNTSGLVDGAHTIMVRAVDTAGNAGAATVTVNKGAGTIDTGAPVVTISNPVNGSSITGLTSVVLNASATSTIGVKRMEIFVDGVYKGYYSKSSISWTWNTSGLASGAHTVMVKAVDTAGGYGSVSATVYK